MFRRIVAVWISLVLLSGLFVIVDVVTDITLPVKAVTITVDDSGGADYAKIQDAINVSNDGDTVFVYSGIYYECITINRSITLAGEDNDTTIIDGDYSGCVVNVTVDWVNITGFTIRDSDSGSFDAGIRLYHVNDTSIYDNKIISNRGDGIRITCSNRTTITGNEIDSNSDYGVYISKSSHSNIIVNNNMSDNWIGVRAYQATGENIISNNTVYSNYYGIYIYQCTDINVTDNDIIKNRDHGIYAYGSQNLNISHNTVVDNDDYGLYLSSSSNNNVTGNTFMEDGIYIWGSQISYFTSNNIPTDNTVNGNPIIFYKDMNDLVIDGMIMGQLIIANCLNFSISNLSINTTDVGIQVAFSSNTTITHNNLSCEMIGLSLYHADQNNLKDNNISDNGRYGLLVTSSDYNTIHVNNLSNNGYYGLYLTQSNNNNISNNIMEHNNIFGMCLSSCHDNIIAYNNISHNDDWGIYVSWSQNNMFKSNNLTEDGIYLYGDLLQYYITNEITNDNTVNGCEVLFYKNQTSSVLDGVIAGQLIIVNCTYLTVTNMAINTTDAAVQVAFSDNITFSANNFSECDYGIYSSRSSNLTISDNIINSNQQTGVYIYRSSNDIITDNNISFNYNGILIGWSTYDTIVNNYVFSNRYGIRLDYSSNCTITSNNCTDNDYGLYLYYSKDNDVSTNLLISQSVYGIYVLRSTGNNITGNNTILDNQEGIYIAYSSNDNLIIGNNISDNRGPGIRIRDSTGNHIEQNTILSNSWDGIYINYRSDDNMVIQNIISNNNGNGIEIYDSSSGNQLVQNTIRSNHNYGIFVFHSGENDIIDNDISSNFDYGIGISQSSDVNIVNNAVFNNSDGIFLYLSHDNVLENNILSGNSMGIRMDGSDGNILGLNDISNHTTGIELEDSFGNKLDNNTVSFNDVGIVLVSDSDNNSLTNNIADHNMNYGIWLTSSNNNSITGNTITDSLNGVHILSTQTSFLAGNAMNGCGIFINGAHLRHWNTHTIDTSNTVNGRPVWYRKDTNGGTIPYGAGQIILANCTGVLVEYQEPRHGTVGIELGFSHGNNMTGNNISLNNLHGIFLYSSQWNEITYNMFFENMEYGICLENSTNNSIYHNNIVDNLNQAQDDRSKNSWDSGYPGGGNYWSDYTGVDLHSTPNQDVPPPDGLGDTPYVIDSNSSDHYPLMVPEDLPEFDFSPPVITSVVVTDITPVSATIRWWTDEPADSRLNYSENSDLSSNTSVFHSAQITSHSITLTSLSPNQTYYFEVISVDSHGNFGKDDNDTLYYRFTTLPPDLTPPVISQVSVKDITENSATIIWLTDEASDSRVNRSVNSDLSANSTVFSGIYTTSHSIFLTNLLPNQTYFFEVTSVDMYGNQATDNNGSQFYTFRTLDVDTDPPVIADISVEPPVQEVHDTIRITASITDDRNVHEVWVNITDPDGETLGNFSMGLDPATCKYYWDTAPDQIGTCSFVIWAADPSNNHNSSVPEQFRVQDTTAPEIAHSVRPRTQEMGGEVNVTASVSDNYAIAEVWIRVILPDQSELENVTMLGTASAEDHWYSRSFTILGDYTLEIWARDESGNWGSASGTFTVVDSESPMAHAGADLVIDINETVVFNGSASTDNHGIDTYTWSFLCNGETITLHGEKPSFLFNTSGNYSVTLEVVDHSGNSASDTMWVKVLPEEVDDGPPDGGETDIGPEDQPFLDTFWWLMVVLIIVVLVVVLFALSKRRGETSDGPEEEEQPETDVKEEGQEGSSEPQEVTPDQPPPQSSDDKMPPPPPPKKKLPPPPPAKEEPTPPPSEDKLPPPPPPD